MRSGIAIITSSQGELSCQFFYIFVAMKQIITFLVAVFAIMSCSNPAGNQDNSKAVLDNILSSKSVRSYTEQEVSQEQIETILKAAMAAPSGVNLQPWRFVVVREQATKEKLAVGFNKMIAQAPVAIVVCGVTTMDNGNPNGNWTADCAAATENLLLAVEALGLGAVWTACYPYDVRMDPTIEALGLPEEVKPYCIVPIGYPAGEDKPKDKWKPENIHYEKW